MTVLDLVPDLDTKEQRRRERELRRMEEASGPMEPELRYRVLMAVLKMETDFLDLADKKARFALMIMSVLNALALVLVVRGQALLAAPGTFGHAIRFIAGCYFAAMVFYIWQAIEALRPRGGRGRMAEELPEEISAADSMRVLFHADIARREREQYRALWALLRLDNVTTELSDQLHMVSRINVLKYRALGRLYQGVGVMTILLTLGLLTVIAGRGL
ncbi:MAG: hypothetical protein K1X31_02395 [Gemmatimonadaceae bacterium]|nr:hypothetical protein [Gemmatimonadaceae bacterium]